MNEILNILKDHPVAVLTASACLISLALWFSVTMGSLDRRGKK